MSRKILFVSNNAWSIVNFRKEIVQHFLQLNIEVHVITPSDSFVSQLTQWGCIHHELNFDNRSTNLLKDIRLYYQFKYLYKKISPDFIFHYVAKPNIYGSMAAGSLKIPSIAIVTGLGYGFSQQNWLYKILTSLYKIALRYPKEVWFLNKEDASLFSQLKIVSSKKIIVLKGEGVNVDDYKPNPKQDSTSFTFIMTSRLIQSKGVVEFYQSILQLNKDGYSCKALLLGTYDAEHPDAISADLLEEWKSTKDFEYLGYQKDVKHFLQQADCFVFPSYYHEGVPKSLMEAASMKLPIITSDTPGCRDVVTSKSGLLVKPQSLPDLINAMKSIMNLSFDQRKEMGDAAREHMILHFDVQQVIKQYHTTIKKYLSI